MINPNKICLQEVWCIDSDEIIAVLKQQSFCLKFHNYNAFFFDQVNRLRSLCFHNYDYPLINLKNTYNENSKIFLFLFLIVGLMSCDIDQTKEGEMPEIDVDIESEAGELPAYAIDWVDLDVGTKTKTVMVPEIEIVMEEKEVEVPYLTANWPNNLSSIIITQYKS